MPDWASEFLTGGFGQGLMVPWNWCMMVAYQLMGYQFDFKESYMEQFMGGSRKTGNQRLYLGASGGGQQRLGRAGRSGVDP